MKSIHQYITESIHDKNIESTIAFIKQYKGNEALFLMQDTQYSAEAYTIFYLANKVVDNLGTIRWDRDAIDNIKKVVSAHDDCPHFILSHGLDGDKEIDTFAKTDIEKMRKMLAIPDLEIFEVHPKSK